MNYNFNDLTGKEFGRLKVIRRALDSEKPHKTSSVFWLCKCNCGETRINSSGNLTSGKTVSCGCYSLEQKKKSFKEKCKAKISRCIICKEEFEYFSNRKQLTCNNKKCKQKYTANFVKKKNSTSLKFNIGSIVHSIKTRSKEKNLECNIDTKFVLSLLEKQDNKCAITQLSFSLTNDEFKKHPWQPSIDRIDPDKGYTKNNIQLVCMMYNFCKHTWTHEDVVTFAKTIK